MGGGALPVSAHVYEMKAYRPLMFASLAGITVIFGTLAVMATLQRSTGVAVFLLGTYAVLVIVGLRAQERTAVRLTVSPAGLDVVWIFGRHVTPWQRVRRIRFLRSQGNPRIQLIAVDVVGDRPLQFFSRLSEFDKLIAQLRKDQPQLIEE